MSDFKDTNTKPLNEFYSQMMQELHKREDARHTNIAAYHVSKNPMNIQLLTSILEKHGESILTRQL